MIDQIILDQIKREAPKHYLQPANKRGYICPLCGNGTGKEGTGLETKDNIHFTCFKCNQIRMSDIINIIQLDKKVNFVEAVNIGAQYAGVILDNIKNSTLLNKNLSSVATNTLNLTKIPATTHKEEYQQLEDYTLFFSNANKHIQETTYHRGLSLTTLNKYNIGYIAGWKNPNSSNKQASNRLIIPTSPNSYLARETNSTSTKFKAIKVGPSQIFNLEALAGKPYVVICEGEIDALSLLEININALALGGVSNINKLIDHLKKVSIAKLPVMLITLDNDIAGYKATKELLEKLKGLNIEAYIYPIEQQYNVKDINELLMRDRALLVSIFEPLNKEPQKEIDRLRNIVTSEALEKITQYSIDKTIKSLQEMIDNEQGIESYPTGFANLDKILEGGFYPGLYIMGALSSLGKTTLCIQIAQQLAKAGSKVIFFSLEMSSKELLAKLVSRETYNINTRKAKTVTGILATSRYKDYDSEDKEIIKKALDNVSTSNLYVYEASQYGIQDIKKVIQEHINIGVKPIVFIDYLQIIKPTELKATDKQNTDINVLALKQLTNEYGVPIMAISSFNRENYTAPVNMASFKESGAIEYSSDVLIGLQYAGMDGKSKSEIKTLIEQNEVQASKGKTLLIEVKVLKNRNGGKGKCSLKYTPMYNSYEAIDETTETYNKYEQDLTNENLDNLF